MKNINLLAILLATMQVATSQSVTVTMLQAPCNADGILSATVTGLTPPLDFNWHYASVNILHSGVMSMTDNFTTFPGTAGQVTVTSSSGTAYANFPWAQPFTYTVTSTPAICPSS